MANPTSMTLSADQQAAAAYCQEQHNRYPALPAKFDNTRLAEPGPKLAWAVFNHLRALGGFDPAPLWLEAKKLIESGFTPAPLKHPSR